MAAETFHHPHPHPRQIGANLAQQRRQQNQTD